MKILKPTYYDKFECKGANCNYNCCQNWSIIVTKDEFKNLKKRVKSEYLKERFKDAFKPRGGGSFSNSYELLMVFNEDGKCKFLTEDGLCGLYNECKPENLPRICQIFPRLSFMYLSNCERYLSVSCERVIELLMEEKDGIKFDETNGEIKDIPKSGAIIATKEKLNSDPIFKYYYNIRFFMITILQNKAYKFNERMVLLGIALNKINELELKNKIEEIPIYINDFLVNMGNYRDLLKSIKRNTKLKICDVFNHLPVECRASHKDVFDVIEKRIKVERNIKTIDNKIESFTFLFDTKEYEKAVINFEKFIENREYIFDNIILEIALQIGIPFRRSLSIWYNYCCLAYLYAAYLVFGSCYINENSTDKDYIYVMSVLGRCLIHNETFVKDVSKTLEDNENNTLADMITFVY